MSEQFVDLFMGLARPLHSLTRLVRHDLSARAKHMGLVLAALADDEGMCAVSKPDLLSYTGMTPETLRRARNELVEQGFVAVQEQETNETKSYRFDRSYLEANQTQVLTVARFPIYKLVDLGLPTHTVNALVHGGHVQIEPLIEAVAQFRSSPESTQRRGFAPFLMVTGVGDVGAQKIVEVVDRWRTSGTAV